MSTAKERYKSDCNIDVQFHKACEVGELELVDYLCQNHDLKNQVDIFSLDAIGFNLACSNGHKKVVNYLINIIKTHEKREEVIKNGLMNCCRGNRVDLFKILLKEEEEVLKKNSNNINMYLDLWCEYGGIEIVKYYMEHDIYKSRIDIHYLNDNKFKQALSSNNMDIIHYLILECNIEKTLHIQMHLNRSKFHKLYSAQLENIIRYDYIEDLFDKRDFKNALESQLPIDEVEHRRIKI